MPTISKEDNTIITAEEIIIGIREKLDTGEIMKIQKKSSNNSLASLLTNHLKG